MQIHGVTEPLPEAARLNPGLATAGGAFGQTLQSTMEATGRLRFSNHAQRRLDARNIRLTPMDVERIARSTDDAMTKGSKESLVLMDRLALVVGVPNRTVITVMEPHEQVNTVFTNIDSVVVVARDVPSAQE